ncbi:MAG: hypothetical protein AB8G18_08860 [Gammaproteobacteria bacterium]
MSRLSKSRFRQAGLSYLEVLIAAAVIAVSAFPVSTALKHAMNSADHSQQSTVRHFQLLEKMEEVLSYPYSDLVLQSGTVFRPGDWSDDAGVADQRLVYIVPADGDNADLDNDLLTGVDNDFLLIRVEYANQNGRLEAIKVRP